MSAEGNGKGFGSRRNPGLAFREIYYSGDQFKGTDVGSVGGQTSDIEFAGIMGCDSQSRFRKHLIWASPQFQILH